MTFNEAYFNWFLEKFNPKRTYTRLFQTMFNTVYVYDPKFELDKNIETNGKDLVWDFFEEKDIPPSDVIRGRSCSFLEAVVSLVYLYKKTISSDETDYKSFFWEMMDNCHLIKYSDEYFNYQQVQAIIKKIVNRSYSIKGNGGLFPRKGNEYNSKELDLIKQFNLYIGETRGS